MIKATILNRSVKGVFTILMLLLFMSSSVNAQKTYTTIKKNVNLSVSNFTHQLSASQDSLIIESDIPFNKVRFLKEDYKKIFEFPGEVYNSKIPLNNLPLGKYTVLFYDEHKIIVFRLARLLPFEKKTEETLEYSIATTPSASYFSLNYPSVNKDAARNE